MNVRREHVIILLFLSITLNYAIFYAGAVQSLVYSEDFESGKTSSNSYSTPHITDKEAVGNYSAIMYANESYLQSIKVYPNIPLRGNLTISFKWRENLNGGNYTIGVIFSINGSGWNGQFTLGAVILHRGSLFIPSNVNYVIPSSYIETTKENDTWNSLYIRSFDGIVNNSVNEISGDFLPQSLSCISFFLFSVNSSGYVMGDNIEIFSIMNKTDLTYTRSPLGVESILFIFILIGSISIAVYFFARIRK